MPFTDRDVQGIRALVEKFEAMLKILHMSRRAIQLNTSQTSVENRRLFIVFYEYF